MIKHETAQNNSWYCELLSNIRSVHLCHSPLLGAAAGQRSGVLNYESHVLVALYPHIVSGGSRSDQAQRTRLFLL